MEIKKNVKAEEQNKVENKKPEMVCVNGVWMTREEFLSYDFD